MFGIGFTEFIIILVFGFLIFGPDKLPKIARTVGHAIGKFRAMQKEASGAVNWKDFLDPGAGDPLANAVDSAEKMKDIAVKNFKEFKEDAIAVGTETKDSLKERKETLSEKKAQYDAAKKKREAEEAKEQKDVKDAKEVEEAVKAEDAKDAEDAQQAAEGDDE